MGSFLGIWIKVLSSVFFVVLLVVSYIIFQKPFKWKTPEFIVAAFLGTGLLIYGMLNFSYIVNPCIKTVKANYVCQIYKGTILGNASCFVDEEGNTYNLEIDPVTKDKFLHKRQFDDSKVYSLIFEAQSNTITSVKELNNN